MIAAEQKVKTVYPEAELRFDFVDVSKYDWSTINYSEVILTNGIWVGDKCIVYGGKFEYKLWRRAWKLIQKEMLKKLEA